MYQRGLFLGFQPMPLKLRARHIIETATHLHPKPRLRLEVFSEIDSGKHTVTFLQHPPPSTTPSLCPTCPARHFSGILLGKAVFGHVFKPDVGPSHSFSTGHTLHLKQADAGKVFDELALRSSPTHRSRTLRMVPDTKSYEDGCEQEQLVDLQGRVSYCMWKRRMTPVSAECYSRQFMLQRHSDLRAPRGGDRILSFAS